MAATISGTIKVKIEAKYVNDPKFVGVYTGDFSYDDTHLTKVGTESINISGGNGNRPGLLSFNFRFLDFATGLTPVIYTASEDFNFPDAPVLGFENGIPSQFGAYIAPGSEGKVFAGKNGFMFGNPGTFFFVLRDGAVRGDGPVTLEINESPPTVPENASPLTSLLAFLGLGVAHLWKKSRAASN